MKKHESLGIRISRLRNGLGWTQNDLADRLAASRVAVSHFEVGLALPSERTVVLLAGLFGYEPYELVEGTDYPRTKAERLPTIACRYTEADLQIACFKRDLAWIQRMQRIQTVNAAEDVSGVVAEWRQTFMALAEQTTDLREQAKLIAALALCQG